VKVFQYKGPVAAKAGTLLVALKQRRRLVKVVEPTTWSFRKMGYTTTSSNRPAVDDEMGGVVLVAADAGRSRRASRTAVARLRSWPVEASRSERWAWPRPAASSPVALVE
jgi:hypothetical protein